MSKPKKVKTKANWPPKMDVRDIRLKPAPIEIYRHDKDDLNVKVRA